jgi:hypothetical protein
VSTVETLVNRPLAIAVLTIMGSIGGAWLKDKLQAESTVTANSVRIAHLEQAEKDAVRRAEFEQFTASILRDLNEIKSELRKR